MASMQHPTARGLFRAMGCKQHEVEPGRSVPNNWDRALFEPWADRKARRAAERDDRQAPSC